jgi:hypothetical protein
MHNLQHICALQLVAGERMTYDEYHAAVNEFASNLTLMEMSAVISHLPAEDILINQLQAEGMTPEEQHLKKAAVDKFASDLAPMEMSAVISHLPAEDILINRLQAEGMTPEEQRFKQFTHAELHAVTECWKGDANL